MLTTNLFGRQAISLKPVCVHGSFSPKLTFLQNLDIEPLQLTVDTHFLLLATLTPES